MQLIRFIVFVVCFSVSISGPQNDGTLDSLVLEPCYADVDISREYHSALYEFSIVIYKSITARSNDFAFSPLSIWIILAAIAEGAQPCVQQQLFRLLRLPSDPCVRQKYYQLATSSIAPSYDVNIVNNRIILIDESVRLNPIWYDLIVQNFLLDVLTAPIRYNPILTAKEIKRLMSARIPALNLNGNSVLLDSMDYSGLWTTEFADARIERATFYNQFGYPIGFVDLMRVKRRARMGYVKKLKAKVLELPVGSSERYRMLFVIFLNTNDVKRAAGLVTKDIVLEMLDSLRESHVPLEVAIPRITMTSEINVRTLLEDLGVTSLWNDPLATRGVSHPPAFPSSFVQRTTLTLNKHGVSSPPIEEPPYNAPTGLDPILGQDFIANRPFMFALLDVKTLTFLMAAEYSVPTYRI